MTATDNHVDAALIKRVLGEYREMPGLALTLEQAQRLWGCDAATCRAVADLMVAHGVLRWSRDRRLVRGTEDFEVL
jgi:hypothetical protein